MKRVLIAALVALAVYFVLIALAAVIVTSGTATLDTRNGMWVAANLVCGLVAGFAGARARPVPRDRRACRARNGALRFPAMSSTGTAR